MNMRQAGTVGLVVRGLEGCSCCEETSIAGVGSSSLTLISSPFVVFSMVCSHPLINDRWRL